MVPAVRSHEPPWTCWGQRIASTLLLVPELCIQLAMPDSQVPAVVFPALETLTTDLR